MITKLSLNTAITDLFMVGESYAKRLSRLNIQTAGDLLHHYPSRYLDFSLVSPINQLQASEVVTVIGQVVSCQNLYTRRRKKIQKLILQDKTGQIEASWFNQPFLTKALAVGKTVALSGKVDYFGPRLSLTSPEYEIIKNHSIPDRQEVTDPGSESLNNIHTGRLVPIYPETRGVSSKWLRSRIKPLISDLVSQVNEFLPDSELKNQQLVGLATALSQIHFPDSLNQAEAARKRLAFNELFLLQLAALERKQNWQNQALGPAFKIDQEKLLEFISSLPFKLTSAQKRVIKEINADLASSQAMNRLLQGEVGSGKTVVAAAAIYLSWLNGYQSILMAPTEILAQQHFKTLKSLLEPFGLKIQLITGSTKKSLNTKYSILNTNLIIGTHALLYDQLGSVEAGLIVIDEQHRFGVGQRGQLIKKAGQASTPHLLTMTATPIPRTVALTLYADLDLSLLDQMPQGRQTVKTWVVAPTKRQSAYSWIKDQLKTQASQAFIVCPLIEASESETLKDVKAATVEFEQLQQVFKGLKLGLLHGRLKAKDKAEIIKAFQQGKINILVSTPVVEVGIDIPNATIMLIEAAERFGLAQLHQLRGRVGRGQKQSYCLLFSTSSKPQTQARLQHLSQINQGAELAEIDLKLRGPGEIYGLKQHGWLNLKLAKFSDRALIKQTQALAKKLIKQLDKIKPLKSKLEKFKISYILQS